MHFLIIDDSDLNIKVISSLLSKMGITCDCVTSALDAYSLLENIKYDLILMDYMMPEINGVDASKYIRNMFSLGFETDYFSKLPIVMLTAEDNFPAVGPKDSYNGYLKKPVSLQSLEQCIRLFVPENNDFNGESEKVFIEGLDADIEECYSYLEIFVSTADSIISTINNALQAEDYNSYTVEVHRLKGEARIISASALAQDAYELECIGKAVNGSFQNEYSAEENILLIKEKTPAVLSSVNRLISQFNNYKKFRLTQSEASDISTSAPSGPTEVEGCAINIETKNKVVRYLDYALESINEKDIITAISWIDSIKEILT